MFLSPSPSFSTVDESLTSRDDQSISELSQDDIEAAQTLEDLRRGRSKTQNQRGIMLILLRIEEVTFCTLRRQYFRVGLWCLRPSKIRAA